MSKPIAFSLIFVAVILSSAVTALVMVLGFKIDVSGGRPAEVASQSTVRSDLMPSDPGDRPDIDLEAKKKWKDRAAENRRSDPTHAPYVYTKLANIDGVQNCNIEIETKQVIDDFRRIVKHDGESIWLTGRMAEMVDDKKYTCKGLFFRAGTYQYSTTSGGTRTIAHYHFSGEAPDLTK